MVWYKGEIISQGYPFAKTLPKTTGTGKSITKGDLVCLDKTAYKWRRAAAADYGMFGIALKDAAEGDAFVNDIVLEPGFIATVEANGAINPFTYCKADDNGLVIAWVHGTDSAELICGQYVGTEQHMDGKTAPVAAADGDIIALKRVVAPGDLDVS